MGQRVLHFRVESRLYLFHLFDYFYLKAKKIRNEIYIKKLRLNKKIHIINMIFVFIKYVIIGLCLYHTYSLIISGVYGIGSMLSLFLAFQGIEQSLTQIYSCFVSLKDFQFVLDDLNELYLLANENQMFCDKKLLNNNIIIENLSYKYPGSESNVLKNINLFIPKGEKIAIVGRNGSGKSTFLNIIAGVFQDYKGNIFVGNELLRTCLSSYREITSSMFQDYIRFNLTIKENIILNRENMDYERVGELLGINHIVEKYDDKYDAVLGQLNSGGIELSGGQWQLLALARGLVDEEKKILILDEPTASLDSQIEDKFNSSFNNISKDKTCLVCTHRLSTALLCDRVLVFEEGEIVEDGNPRSLLTKRGVFSEMFNAQKAFYT